MKNHAPIFTFSLALLTLAGCSAESDEQEGAAAGEQYQETSVAVSDTPAPEGEVDASSLRLEGLGDLTIGKPIPETSKWAVRGGQASEDCQTASSPDFPGSYAMLVGGDVKRITISDDSGVTLVEGIGPGSTEAEVRAEFPSFVASPHKYVEAPAKYLTQPGNDPRLRFEIDADGKVSLVHVGVMPELEFVEGCA